MSKRIKFIDFQNDQIIPPSTQQKFGRSAKVQSDDINNRNKNGYYFDSGSSDPNNGGSIKLKRKDSVRKNLKQTFKRNLKNKKIQRKEQNIVVYFVTLFFTFLMGSQNLYIFMVSFPGKNQFIFFPSLIIRPIFFIASSYYLTKNWLIIAKLYFAFDRVLLAIIATSISIGVFSSMYIPFAQVKIAFYAVFALNPILFVSFAGYIRVMIVFCDWKSWQTILIKVAIAVGAASYFGLGMYYTIVNREFTGGKAPQVDKTILNLLFLYAFAGFDFHIQLFSLFDQADGTNRFRGIYHLQCQEQAMQCLLHGKKINVPEKQQDIFAEQYIQYSNNKPMLPIIQNIIQSQKYSEQEG